MLHSEQTNNSLLHSPTNNDSKISVDSDTGTAIQETRPPFKLRVINPDFYEEDNESTMHPYKPTLVPNSVSSTPELRHATIQQQPRSTVVIPTTLISTSNAWQNNSNNNNNEYSFSEPTSPQQQQPTVIRKVSKILVEHQTPIYRKSTDLELLPPLETLPPLIGTNESHLLSTSTPTTASTSTTSNGGGSGANLSPTTLNQISPLEALSIKSTASSNSPPTLPQHHSDYFFNKGAPSVAQQSINAMVISTAETVHPSPDLHQNSENDHDKQDTEVEAETPTSPIMASSSLTPAVYNYNQQSDRRSSRELLYEQHNLSTNNSTTTSPLPRLSSQQHTRTHSFTPSLTGSVMTTHTLQQQHQQQHPSSSSRYNKASYSLTNHPDAIKLYRTMAMKTGDPTVQLTYAKYLLEVASLYDSKEKRQPFRPNLSLSLPMLKRPGSSNSRPSSIASSRRSSMDTHISINTFRRDSSATIQQQQHPITDDEEAAKKKKKKMLEEEGVHWIKKLAKARVGEAAYLLGLWYERGMYGFRKSSTKAIKFYEIATEGKVPEAMFAVGQYHEKEQDYMTSFKLYEDAAGLGLVEALYVSFSLYRDRFTAIKLIKLFSWKNRELQ